MAKLDRQYQAQHSAEGGGEKKGVGDDPRLTLYALGEMEDAERRSFEDSLIDTKNAALRADEIRAIGALIGQALAVEAGAPAPRTVRKRKRSGLALWLSFPLVLLPVAGAVVAGVLIYFWLQKPEEEAASGSREKVDFKLKPANWKEGDPLPEESLAKVGEGGGSSGAPASSRPSAKTGGRATSGHTGRTAAGSPAYAAGDRQRRPMSSDVDSPIGQTEPDKDLEDGSAALAGGGVPMGEKQGAVAALLRGKTGQALAVTNAAAAGSTEFGHPDEVASAKNDGEQGSADAGKPDAANDEKKKAGQAAKPKAKVPGEKNKGERQQREFASPKEAKVSQLPADVAAKSVGVLKKALAKGRRPDPKAVKVEELLNYFPVPAAEPKGADLFAATLEAAEAPWDVKKRLVRVSLKGKSAPMPERGAASLVLLVDISGSMVAPNRLPLVKEAVRLLLGRLRPDDRIGLVTFAIEPRLALLPTPVAETQEILRVFESLEAKGPTNGGAGMELAYDLAKAHVVPNGRNCVIMCTDGDFNSGPTKEEELAKIIDRQKDSGVKLSIYGFGRGRQIDARLEKLALRGGGASGYVNTRREAEQVLTGEINGIFSPLAKNLEVKVVFNPELVEGYRLLGYDEPTDVAAGKVVVAPERKTVLPGHTLTALYEVIPKPGAPAGDLLNVQLNYQTPADGAPHKEEFSLRDHGMSFAQANLDFKFAAAVGAFGLVLSEQAPDGMTLDTVEKWAKDCLGDDIGGYRSEFLALVEQARAIKE
jgi:Ca-activated chloride channel family protein